MMNLLNGDEFACFVVLRLLIPFLINILANLRENFECSHIAVIHYLFIFIRETMPFTNKHQRCRESANVETQGREGSQYSDLGQQSMS